MSAMRTDHPDWSHWGDRLRELIGEIHEIADQIASGEVPRSEGRRQVDKAVRQYHEDTKIMVDPDYPTIRELFTLDPET